MAVRTVCDNLKTGVAERPKEGEVVLNRTYEALGTHYGTAIMPTGVRKPKHYRRESVIGELRAPTSRDLAPRAGAGAAFADNGGARSGLK